MRENTVKMVELIGIEPTTSSLRMLPSTIKQGIYSIPGGSKNALKRPPTVRAGHRQIGAI